MLLNASSKWQLELAQTSAYTYSIRTLMCMRKAMKIELLYSKMNHTLHIVTEVDAD